MGGIGSDEERVSRSIHDTFTWTHKKTGKNHARKTKIMQTNLAIFVALALQLHGTHRHSQR